MPSTIRYLRVILLHIIDQRQVLNQKVSYAVARMSITALYGRGIIAARGAAARLIFDVVAEERAEFKTVSAFNFGEIILPYEEVFMVLPGRLVPQIVIPARAPEEARHDVVIPRKDRGE